MKTGQKVQVDTFLNIFNQTCFQPQPTTLHQTLYLTTIIFTFRNYTHQTDSQLPKAESHYQSYQFDNWTKSPVDTFNIFPPKLDLNYKPQKYIKLFISTKLVLQSETSHITLTTKSQIPIADCYYTILPI